VWKGRAAAADPEEREEEEKRAQVLLRLQMGVYGGGIE
jgi:hypothetical protein